MGPEHKTRAANLLAAQLVLAAGILAADLAVERGAAVCVLYVCVILLSLWIPGWRNTAGWAVATLAFSWLDFALSEPVDSLWKAVLNRGAASLTIVAAAYAVRVHKDMQEQVAHWARVDALTGVMNRRFFSEALKAELAGATENKSSLALLFIDLDQFKEVNDKAGHAVGDRVLIEVGRVLREALPGGIVGRLGGDEFAAVLMGPANRAHTTELASRLSRQLGEAATAFARGAQVGASVGVACFPDDGDDLEALLKCADQAMYAAKQQSRR